MMPINRQSLRALLCLSLLSSLWSGGLMADESLVIATQGQGSINLNSAMEMAYQHSFSRRSAEEDLAGSEARQSVLKGSLGPKLSVDASRGWIDTDVNKLAGKSSPVTGQHFPDEINSVGVTISQPISQLFANKDRLNAEEKVAESSRLQVAAEGNDAKLRGAEAYIAALKAVRFLAISRENQQLIDKQKKDAGSLRSAGKLSDLDYSRFELAASEANTQVIEAKAALRVANENLHEVLGLAPGQAIQLTELEGFADAPNVEGKERVELEGAGRRVEALESQLKAQKVDYWPQISAFARYTRDFETKDLNIDFAGFQYSVPKDDYRDQFSYGFNLQWDIWDWGSRSGRAAEIGTQVSRARIQKDALASKLRLETAQADADWNKAQEVLRDAKIADKLSADILRAFDIKFKNGLATTTDLLGVQRDRIRAQAQLANATYDLHGALLRKRRAAGGML